MRGRFPNAAFFRHVCSNSSQMRSSSTATDKCESVGLGFSGWLIIGPYQFEKAYAQALTGGGWSALWAVAAVGVTHRVFVPDLPMDSYDHRPRIVRRKYLTPTRNKVKAIKDTPDGAFKSRGRQLAAGFRVTRPEQATRSSEKTSTTILKFGSRLPRQFICDFRDCSVSVGCPTLIAQKPEYARSGTQSLTTRCFWKLACRAGTSKGTSFKEQPIFKPPELAIRDNDRKNCN